MIFFWKIILINSVELVPEFINSNNWFKKDKLNGELLLSSSRLHLKLYDTQKVPLFIKILLNKNSKSSIKKPI